FSEISKKHKFKDLNTFNTGLAAYAKSSCTKDDVNFFYDFRGDSNFKPNSPESNGMIWFSSSIMNQCQSPSKAMAGKKITDKDCVNYFSKPFTSRLNAARAGLASRLFRDTKWDTTFSDT